MAWSHEIEEILTIVEEHIVEWVDRGAASIGLHAWLDKHDLEDSYRMPKIKPVNKEYVMRAIHDTVNHGRALESVIKKHTADAEFYTDAGWIDQSAYHTQMARTNQLMLDTCRVRLGSLMKYLK